MKEKSKVFTEKKYEFGTPVSDLPVNCIMVIYNYNASDEYHCWKFRDYKGERQLHWCNKKGKLDPDEGWEDTQDTSFEEGESIIYPYVTETPLYKAIYGEE